MCSCVPPPASLKPRKIYNFLVPDVFDSKTVPDIAEPTNASTMRKIGKLQEYVEKNPSKAGKVSRRLSRRIKKALYDHQLGYVRVAVDAYCCLLNASVEEGSTYTFGYFNKELVHQPDALISTLLSYQRPQIKTLGAQLLATYVHVQTPVEHQAQLVADLVARVLTLTNSSGPGTISTPGTEDGEKGKSGVTSSANQLRQECLTVLAEYVNFCQRLKILPQLLEQIEVSLLDSLEQDLAAGVGIRKLAASEGSDAPSSKAGDILGNFKPFLQDTSSVRRVVGALLQWLDKNNRWENPQLVKELVGLVHDACGGLTYPLTSSLLRHCASEPSLTPRQRAMVARLAVQQSAVYSLSAFNLALLELPRALAASHRPQGAQAAPAEDLKELHVAAAEVCVGLAREVGHAGQVCEAMATVLRGQLASGPDGTAAVSTAGIDGEGDGAAMGSGTQLRLWTLECGLAVAESLRTLPEQARHLGGRTLPPALLSAITSAVTYDGKNHHAPTATLVSSLAANGIAPGAATAAVTAGIATHTDPATAPTTNAADAAAAAAAAATGAAGAAGAGPAGGDGLSGAAAVRGLGVRLLAALLPCLDGPLKDDRQAVQLLVIVAALAGNVSGSTPPAPLEVAAASRLVHAATDCNRPAVLLQAARTALTLGHYATVLANEGAGAGTGAAGNGTRAVAATAVAVLAQSAMLQLAGVAQCSQLNGCKIFSLSDSPLPELMSPASDHLLSATAPAWSTATRDTALKGAGKLGPALTAWRAACMGALLSEGVLQAEWGANLKQFLEQPLHAPHPQAQQPASASRSLANGKPPGVSDSVATASRTNATSWVSRQISIRKERLNIARVMDILGGEEEEGDEEQMQLRNADVGPSNRTIDAVDVALKSKPGVPLVTAGGKPAMAQVKTLQDVLRLAQEEALGAEQAPLCTVVDGRQLVTQVEQLAC